MRNIYILCHVSRCSISPVHLLITSLAYPNRKPFTKRILKACSEKTWIRTCTIKTQTITFSVCYILSHANCHFYFTFFFSFFFITLFQLQLVLFFFQSNKSITSPAIFSLAHPFLVSSKRFYSMSSNSLKTDYVAACLMTCFVKWHGY